MKLSTKIFLGFASVIAISMTIGLVSWWALSNTSDSFLKEQLSSSLRMMMASARQQEKNFQIRGYRKIGEDKENAYEKWEKAGDGLTRQIDKARMDGLMLPDQAESLNKLAGAYKGSFQQFVGFSQKNGEILAIWREIGAGFNAEIKNLRDNTAPGDRIFLAADALETEFVLMRVAALYYIKDGTSDAWEKFVSAMKSTGAKGDALAVLTGNNAKLEIFSQSIVAHLTRYTKSAMEYHDNDLKKAAGEVEMINTSRDFEKTLADMQEAQLKELNLTEKKASGLTMLMCLLSLTLGLLVSIYLTRFISVSFQRIVGKLENTTTEITTAANQLTDTSSVLAQASNEQASSLEETASSLEEIGGMVAQNVENAKEAQALAQKVQQVSATTNGDMVKLQGGMQHIAENTERIRRLVNIITNIGEKTEIMHEIVFQTKLLSFNASVEAERAGEHGRGFAVVAQEVGNLAQMTGKAAQEIAVIVQGSIKEAELITTESKQQVEDCISFLNASAGGMKSIMQSAETVTKSATQVVSASKDQATGIQQINTTMTLLEQVTQTNAATAETTSTSSEQLREQLTSLHQCIGELIFVVSGTRPAEKGRKLRVVA